jgi:hypothetical protein
MTGSEHSSDDDDIGGEKRRGGAVLRLGRIGDPV